MKVRLYIAPQIGDGSYLNPYRSPCTQYCDFTQGHGVQEVDTPARRISLAYVLADDAAHAAIVADTTITPLSPLMDDSDLSSMDGALTTLPNLTTIKAKLETMGISTEWLSAANTFRDVIRYIVRLFHCAQMIRGNANAFEVLKANLTTTVGDVPVAVRNAIRNWMQARGLAVGWINNSTTVREVLHFIIQNLGFGKFKIRELEF